MVIGIFTGYGLVFWGSIIFSDEIRFVRPLSWEIILWDKNLSKDILIFQSNTDISSGVISSICDIDSRFIERSQDLYFFEIDYSASPSCSNSNFVLKMWDSKVANAGGKISITSEKELLLRLLDYDSPYLKKLLRKAQKDSDRFAIFSNYNQKNLGENIKFAQNKQKYYSSVFAQKLLTRILDGREKKYATPVPWYGIWEAKNKLPNAGRPYRSEYTDGIHRWWDIDAPNGSDIVALDDGIIVRVVDDFDESNFQNIVYWDNLRELQELKNLDILRGNQVWLKTMKWDVVFYSHMENINPNTSEWDTVTRGEYLGTTGISWVPWEWYNDYHLHFSIMKNPYNHNKAGIYNLWDYMMWDWTAKGMSYEQTLELKKQIFE